jgi:hypothetical protein
MLFRKIATILLLSFLFFNWVGGWLLVSWMECRENARWESRLDNGRYDAGELICIRISAQSLPYCNASATFQESNGDIEIGNTHYRYVGKRLYNDSLEFLCLPHRENSRLQTAKNGLFHLVNDLPDGAGGDRNKSSPAGKLSQSLLQTFCPRDYTWHLCNFPPRTDRSCRFRTAATCQGYVSTGKQPPKDQPLS